jgi:hypothetical protein
MHEPWLLKSSMSGMGSCGKVFKADTANTLPNMLTGLIYRNLVMAISPLFN